MKTAIFFFLTATMAMGQTAKPAKPLEPWTACSCAGKPCKPPMDNMNGGTAKACKRVGGVWKPVGPATVQLIFTPEQAAAYPGSAWMLSCGPDNHDDACVQEPSKATPILQDSGGPPCISCITTIAEPMPVVWAHEVKNGVYTATLTDPTNHWRCFVSSMVRDEGIYGNVSAFTVSCYDTTKNTPVDKSVPVPDSKGAAK